MKRYRPKIQKQKMRKQKKIPIIFKKRIFWDIILGMTLFGTLFYFLFFSQCFAVEDIKILGAKSISRNEVFNFLEEKIGGRSLFLIRTADLSNELLERYPEIENIKFKRKFPRSLILNIEEKKAIGILETKDKELFLIDSKGEPFQDAGEKKDKDFVFIKGDERVEEKTMDIILLIDKSLTDNFEIRTEFFSISADKLDVKVYEGWNIYFSLDNDIELAFEKLELLLEKEISLEQRKNLEYIDLRFSRAYYK